ncbi:MAG: triose-phosphate isomerase [Spirochaetes bacterium]|nr:MAG: triose-phosphate isomerase [Spirochaetota bacterium]
MRRAFIAGNWKMNLEKGSAVELAKALVDGTRNITDRDVLICPSFPLLPIVNDIVSGSNVWLGAQNMYYEKKGAFTGEVSADMLKSVGCEWVILGHSERRHVFHEDDSLINKKVKSAIEQGLKPILCVGELLEERESGKTEEVVKRQVVEGLKEVSPEDTAKIIIAYEPVWAIGTGKTATPEDADSIHSFIRDILRDLYNSKVSENMRILYGGSVKPENIDSLMAKDNIDGALVGGASLKADSFLRIINANIQS